MHELPCGCRSCGCICNEHYRDGYQECPKHRPASGLITLISVALMIACVVTFCATGDYDNGLHTRSQGISHEGATHRSR